MNLRADVTRRLPSATGRGDPSRVQEPREFADRIGSHGAVNAGHGLKPWARAVGGRSKLTTVADSDCEVLRPSRELGKQAALANT